MGHSRIVVRSVPTKSVPEAQLHDSLAECEERNPRSSNVANDA